MSGHAAQQVVVDRIAPDYTGSRHGFEIDPRILDSQGFDSRINLFKPEYVPSLPLSINPSLNNVNAISVVKVISRPDSEGSDSNCGGGGSDRNCIKTASVLTVLRDIPANGGGDLFRPPYVEASGNKLFKSTNSLRTDFLPTYTHTPDAKTLNWVVDMFSRVHLSHLQGTVHNQRLRPKDYMPSYGADYATRTAEGALALMLNNATAEKLPAVIAYTQVGLDYYGMLAAGKTWEPNGGHGLGSKLPLIFAATILDDAEMKAYVSSRPTTTFHEDGQLHYSQRAGFGNGAVLYGQALGGDAWNANMDLQYWRRVSGVNNNATIRDPYGYVDGGGSPGTSYQFCCNSMPWKYTALAMNLMPQLKPVWNYDLFLEYVDRWVYHGAWALPDPCAPLPPPPFNLLPIGETPADPTLPTYGRDFGPKPNAPGECILDPNLATYTSPTSFTCQAEKTCGRFPNSHGANTNSGNRNSNFGDAMWNAYR